MEKIICVCLILATLLIIAILVYRLASDYEDTNISFEHTGKKGNKTAFSFKGKKKTRKNKCYSSQK